MYVLLITRVEKNEICYYMGSEIGYAYSLKMAKEMKDLGISTYPIYFDKNQKIVNREKIL